MAVKKNRIGFLLASIDTGSGINMWKPLVREASHSNAAFYIFPGGRLNSPQNSEYLRNSIYSLANKDTLDGIISWGSTIGGFVSVQELNSFHNKYASIPYVTIAHKMPGHSCVKFDAYNGMAELVRHFLTVHGASKIAFLRGPEAHSSSMERYRAFCDVMASAGHDMRKSLLVSSPFPWSEGDKAVIQLVNERGFLPGRDFEVLIGASDMMTFSAVRYLQKAGYSVPADYKCGGFNDSVESRISGSAFSTVRMPYSELALTAFDMIKKELASKKRSADDVVLPCDMVIRESCGCSSSAIALSPVSCKTRKELTESLTHLLRLDETSANAVIEPIVNVLVENNESLLFSLLIKALERFFLQDMDIRLLFKAFSLVKSSSFLPTGLVSGYESRFLMTVAQVQNRVAQEISFRELGIQTELNRLKCELLEARSRTHLLEILAKHLPKLEIHSAALVFTESDTVSYFAGGFSDGRLTTEGFRFSSGLILPENVQGFDSGVFLVQPLFLEKQPIGHIVCSVPSDSYKGAFFEELRSAISSALSGVFLFEETTLAKQKAEQAEQTKTEFFANVGSDLCEPLVAINRKIEQIEKLLADGCSDTDILQAQMVFLKNRIAEQLDKTNLILELTLSQADELPIDRQLFHAEDAIWGDDSEDARSDAGVVAKSAKSDAGVVATTGELLPLIYGDPARFKEALSIICAEWNVPLRSVSLLETDEGLDVSIDSGRTVPPDTWRKNAMCLAERIFILFGASIEKTKIGCRILYPWPTFACHPAESSYERFRWNADEAELEEWASLFARRRDPDFLRTAFICKTSLPQKDLYAIKTFDALFERHLSSGVKNPVVFVGTEYVKFSSWVTAEQSVLVSDLASFEETVAKLSPSLVVLDSLNVGAVEKIRHNPVTELCPVFVLPEHILEEDDVTSLMRIPRVILANRCVACSEEFAVRARAVLAGEEVLPPDTGALVKKAVCYLNVNAGSQISRWKLADSVHVSEDYLTRIFHKETGLSPWEYLNRYRIFLASQLLLHTNSTVYDVAEKCGFQDQAYFCRVFKKIHGVPPGKFRSNPEKLEK
ncbi:MAG: helix-turn-helix domain-containing protein [Treponemataceae bacterium]|nr:helix-turn-helix domain-containing protein [Treponemataceae bacterium]